MRWGDFRRSDNVEDRTEGAPEGSGGGFGGGFPGGGGFRIGGGALVVIVIASLIFGVNPLEMLGLMEGSAPVAPQAPPPQAAPSYGPQHAAPSQPPGAGRRQDPSKDFVAAILGDTEDVWGAIF